MTIIKRITEELDSYNTGIVYIAESIPFSAWKIIRRIGWFQNHHYPTGQYDGLKNYKYWFDIIPSRVDSEVKNIDLDSKDPRLESDSQEDAGRLLIANARLPKSRRETGQAAKFNEMVERGTEWGNLVAKKVKEGYKLMELENFMVLNQTAETLEDSDVIETEVMTPIEMRAKSTIWNNVDVLIKSGKKEYNKTAPEF